MRRSVLRRIIKQIEQGLFEQNGIQCKHRQVGREFHLDFVLGQDFGSALQGTAHDLAYVVQREVRHDGAGLQLGHIEKVGDEAIEPLTFVDNCRKQFRPLGLGKIGRKVSQGSSRTQHRRQRGLEVVRDRGEQAQTAIVRLRPSA